MSSSTTKRTAKRRAPKACERCRIRKVRCDIVHRDDQCTNCALDEVECIDTLSRRQAKENRTTKDKPKMRKVQPARSSLQELEDNTIIWDSLAAGPELVSPPSTAVNFSPDANCPAVLGAVQNPPHIEDHFPDFTLGLLKDGDLENHTGIPSPATSLEKPIAPGNVGASQIGDLVLPSFIAPINSERCIQHWEFLHAQGAFNILDEKLRNVILTSYVHYVHPQLPVVDIHEILQALATNGRDYKISLLLLQAMLLSGCSFVEMEYIRAAGFESRMALKKELADRVRLLYDFDSEVDRLTLVQALILMTCWQEKGDEVKHLRHWIGIAYNISVFIGLNKDPAVSSLSPRRKHLWKRVWWSCYIRDRMLALGLRHPPIIPEEDCESPDLVLDDFDIRPATSDVLSAFNHCGLLHDLDQQHRLAEVCIAQQQLCHNISKILRTRFQTIVPKLGCTSTRTLVSAPKISRTNSSPVQTCAFELTAWFRDLPDQLKYRSPSSLQFAPEQHLLMFHCALLNLFYYALVCILHRPWPPPIARALPASELCSQRTSRHAANAIISILRDLQFQEMIHLLPTSGITCLLQAAVTHLCDAATSLNSLRDRSRYQLETCLEYLDSLMEVHIYSHCAKSFLVSAAAKLYQDPKFNRAIEVSTETQPCQRWESFHCSPSKLPSPYDLFLLQDSSHSIACEPATDIGIKEEMNAEAATQDDLLDVFDYSLLDLSPDLFFNLGPGDFDHVLSN
ncbi:uncharacterized protein A1O9_02412 [Exophiala aquamarina CBS 119918]|uniref:Zn(2)-C6 fungal-type domain-containing protein n=1 Tax=Exophiala aquamarina CBS 119918 TaxID=1182545 RepID=A0A072PZ09_9EURO|nr:uncharacterized protein A1O9_02412 [Exophiala aquamarina CBS 119918]KEF60850.1 hypothetical protein A1O9_02412 [Exophiala aquamarina CBS 119918]